MKSSLKFSPYSTRTKPENYPLFRNQPGHFFSFENYSTTLTDLWCCADMPISTKSNRVIKIFYLIILLSLIITLSYDNGIAQTGHEWRTFNLHPENNDLNAVDLAASGWAVAIGNEGLIEVSIDTGATWKIANALVSAMLNSITILDSKIAIAIGDSGYILRSGNGFDWTIFRISGSERLTGISSDESGTLFLISSSGIVRRSLDSGITWNAVGKKFQQPLLAVKAISSSVILLSGANGMVAHSLDSGMHWITDSLTSVDLGHISIASPSSWYVAGKKWSLFNSSDSGRTWNKLIIEADTTGAGNAEFHNIGFFSPDSGSVFVREGSLGYYDVYSTTNGGKNWKPRTISSFGGMNSFSTSFGNKAIMAGLNGSLKLTRNRGGFWRQVDSVTVFIHDIMAFTDVNLGVTCGWDGTGLTFYVTNDGGNIWKKTSRFQTRTLRVRSISFPSENLCIVAGDSGILMRSVDSCKSWQRITLHDSIGIGTLKMYDSRSGILYAVDNSIRRTIDGGVTWSSIPSAQITISTFTYLNDRVLLALEGKLIYRSDDSGLVWRQYGNLPFSSYKMVFADSSHGWASSEQDIIMATVDGGVSWTTQLNKGTDGIIDLAFNNTKQGIAVGYLLTRFETINSGTTWTQDNSSLPEKIGYDAITAVQFPFPEYAVGITGSGVILRKDYSKSSVQSSDKNMLSSNVFPNPLADERSIKYSVPETSTIQLNLTNSLGQVVLSKNLDAMENVFYEIRLPKDIARGMYLLTGLSPHSIFRNKLIIAR